MSSMLSARSRVAARRSAIRRSTIPAPLLMVITLTCFRHPGRRGVSVDFPNQLAALAGLGCELRRQSRYGAPERLAARPGTLLGIGLARGIAALELGANLLDVDGADLGAGAAHLDGVAVGIECL